MFKFKYKLKDKIKKRLFISPYLIAILLFATFLFITIPLSAALMVLFYFIPYVAFFYLIKYLWTL
jgi:hypothetical protein